MLSAAPADKISAAVDEWPELLGRRALTTRLFVDRQSAGGGLFRGLALFMLHDDTDELMLYRAVITILRYEYPVRHRSL